MIAVVQRVAQANVSVGEETLGVIGKGLVILLGINRSDTQEDAAYLSEKIVHLRVFGDDQGKMNRSLMDIGGEILVVSQFTLLGDCRKGRRPSFVNAAEPQVAEKLYAHFTECCREKGVKTQTGRFRAMMQVSLINDGPVTLIIESR